MTKNSFNTNARFVTADIKRRLKNVIERGEMTKTELAARIGTSRSQLDRLLNGDPYDYSTMYLGTLEKAAEAVRRKLEIIITIK